MNGVGPYWFPAKLVNYLSRKYNFSLEAANKHDTRYKYKQTTRIMCDNQFLLDCLKDARTSNEIQVSVIFYVAVRLFGWISWRKHSGRK